MATSWRDILPKVLAERESVAVSTVSSVSPDDFGELGPNGSNRPNSTLPTDIAAGVALLQAMPSPKRIRADAWAQVVHDAVEIADSWALQALHLGWNAIEIFGSQPDASADASCDGLAVRLGGRRLLAITDSFAIVQHGSNGRAYLYRRTAPSARLLWEMGRGR